ncbi:response regulator transcription factor [Roseateles sp. NT4]|uniref:response regulator transcription factor n=1 Tax=Roseateles sp. NT4 TaxID=3453715 RepID=UPI003EE8696A
MDIFVVERSAALRRQLVRRLEAMDGIRIVGESANRRRALTLIKWTRPDVALADLAPDEGSGPSLVAELHTVGYAGRIAVLAAHAVDALRDARSNAGTKPIHADVSGWKSLLDDLTQALPRSSRSIPNRWCLGNLHDA